MLGDSNKCSKCRHKSYFYEFNHTIGSSSHILLPNYSIWQLALYKLKKSKKNEDVKMCQVKAEFTVNSECQPTNVLTTTRQKLCQNFKTDNDIQF